MLRPLNAHHASMRTPAMRKREAPISAGGTCSTAMRMARYVDHQNKYTRANANPIRNLCCFCNSNGVMRFPGKLSDSPEYSGDSKYLYPILDAKREAAYPCGHRNHDPKV